MQSLKQKGLVVNLIIGTKWRFEHIRNGKVINVADWSPNVTTNDGRDVACAVLHQAAHGGIAGFDYLTVGSTDYEPAAGDAALTGEVNADGLERTHGVYTDEAGVGAWKLENTFTYTGAGVTIYTGAVFNAATGVTMIYAAKFATPAILASGDQLKVTCTGTVGAA